jgi:hypothetical protein
MENRVALTKFRIAYKAGKTQETEATRYIVSERPFILFYDSSAPTAVPVLTVAQDEVLYISHADAPEPV